MPEMADMHELAAVSASWGVVPLVVLLALYFLPSIIGASRKVVNIGSVVAINLLLGWTLIGWAVAMAMALRTNPPHAYQRSRDVECEPCSRGDHATCQVYQGRTSLPTGEVVLCSCFRRRRRYHYPI